MAGLRDYSESPGGSLLLRIENREPFPTPLLAELLSALSGDYRKASGHDLIVSRIEQGSVILQFIDWAANANELYDFGKNLAELVVLIGGGFFALRSRRKGTKTVQAIVELSAKTGSEVTIYHQSTDGETLFVHMTPPQSIAIRERAEAYRRETEARRERVAYRSDASIAEKALESFITTAAKDGLSPDDPSDGLMALLVEVIRALRDRPDGRVVLDRIRSKLLASGHHKAISLLEELIRK